MAIPNYDALSVQLSRFIADTPSTAAATADGKRWTSAQRDNHLNYSIKEWMQKQLASAVQRENNGQSAAQNWHALRLLTAEEAQTLSNNAKALSSWTGGVMYILAAQNATDTVDILPLPTQQQRFIKTTIGFNNFINGSTTRQYYVIDAGSFRLLDGGTTTNDSVKLRYLKQPPTFTANTGSTDIDTYIPSEYWRQILDLAIAFALEEYPTPENISRIQTKLALVDRQIFDAPPAQ